MEMGNELTRVDELLNEIEVKTKQLHEMIKSTNSFLYKSLRETIGADSEITSLFTNANEFEKLYQMEVAMRRKEEYENRN